MTRFLLIFQMDRSIRVPLVWFPRPLRATPAQREKFQLSSRGIHWEDILVDGLLAGRSDMTILSVGTT